MTGQARCCRAQLRRAGLAASKPVVLRAGELRRLPVVVDGHLVGIVTRGDLMRALTLVCEERCGEVVGGTIDKVADMELVHNPFPGRRLKRPS